MIYGGGNTKIDTEIGSRKGREVGKQHWGETDTGAEIEDIVKRRKETLDQVDPASTWIKQSANRRIQQARTQGGPKRMTEQQERQIGREAESDIGKAMYMTQRQNLTDYQKLMGNIASNLGSTEMGYSALEVGQAPTALPPTSSGMCFITTAICDYLGFADDCYILNTFRKFRDDFMKVHDDMKKDVEEYYAIAPEMSKRIEGDAAILNHLTIAYLLPCLALIESEQNMSAYKKYKEMVKCLQEIV